MSTNEWMKTLTRDKKPLPLLSFPATTLLGVSVYELTHDASLQAKGIAAVAARTDAAAAVTMMDLSVEAEAFGCTVNAPENEVPTIVGAYITDLEEAQALAVPSVGTARSGLYVEAARLAKTLVTDRPVLAGIIGPFSLAGRLMDVTEALVNCMIDPDFVHAALEKATAFLIAYAKAYKAVGVDGLVMAEPLAGLLSPALEREFSAPYVKRLLHEVQDDGFGVIYHNCGPNTPQMTESLFSLGAAAYHFGDAVSLDAILSQAPEGVWVMGNLSPANEFLGGTPASMVLAVKRLLASCGHHPRFVLSSGCDIPPAAKWETIDAFFQSAKEYRR